MIELECWDIVGPNNYLGNTSIRK